MTPERWARIKRLYHETLGYSANQRGSFLAEACAGDHALRREVESLLAQEGGAAFLSTPAVANGIGGGIRIGQALGPYTISAQIGEGGMGEVYRARDTKLHREVALKMLPTAFALDPDRLARFEREARVLAALNHPHIAAIYGFEESNGVQALVLELVEGPTLADRIAKGPIPFDEALLIAKQIAEALDAAHEQGIIHRDLKPANIKVRPDGTVKVLDFGLAKALEPASGMRSEITPAITTPAMTATGVVLGTAAYMSPEQAKGRPVDKRCDIWAFGCVLYEMLTGRRAFAADGMSDTIAAILRDEPDWDLLGPRVPEPILILLRRCLEKDHKQRLRDVGDARLELESRGEWAARSPTRTANRRTERIVWMTAVAGVALIAVSVFALALRPTAAPATVRLEITTPPVSQPDDLASLALSPDGRALAFVASVDGQPHLWVRPLDSVVSRPLPGTGGAESPFWSPDSRSVAFFADGRVKRIDLDGGLVRTLTQGGYGGGAWNREGTMLFAPSPASAIVRMSASGQSAGTAVTRLEKNHASHSYPEFLPDGRHFLYYVIASPEARGVWLGQIDGPLARRLIDADSAAAYASGHIFFVREKTVFAQEFDAERLELKGTPFLVEDGMTGVITLSGHAPISAAAGGAIAFRLGSARGDRQFVWVDRSGREIRMVGNPGNWNSPSPSADLSRLAVAMRDATGNADVWLMETRRGILSRFTTHPAEDVFPVWSHDGSRIAFASNRSGELGLYQKADTGIGDEEVLLPPGSVAVLAADWSPDGKFLLYDRLGPEMGLDLWVVPLGGGKPFPVIQTESDERDGQFSPDGKWIAYHSDHSGRFEVYLQPFPGPGAPVRVSTNGGAQVRWRQDGRELFYIGLDGRLMAVPIQLSADRPTVVGVAIALFATRVGYVIQPWVWGAQYVVSADGQSFLMSNFVEPAGPTPVRLILNWKPVR